MGGHLAISGRATPARYIHAMFDHVGLRVRDRSASERFYRELLGAVGIEPTHAGAEFVEWDDFALMAAEEGRTPTQGLHVGFVASSREAVDRWWQTGVQAGYPDDGAPGPRPQYMPDYYGAFLRDPDANSVEAVHHGDVRRGGHIDHLWIGVRDLEAVSAFYVTLAPRLGLREGSRTEIRRQFCGAWATFSLVADGRPPTSGLHMAFPAPDRITVDEFHAAAIAAGYRSDGAPGPRPQYHPGYYAAYVLDPQGTSVECVFHGPGG